MENFWGFEVWGFWNLIAALLMSLLAANVLKKTVPFLRRSLIPHSVLGGGLLLLVGSIYRLFSPDNLFETPFFGGNGIAVLETLTYHTLALGFIASALKIGSAKLTKERTAEIVNTGMTTVSTYLLQAVLGMAITMVAARVMKDFFPAAGILLPFGYGQGTGQAMNYGNIYEMDYGFSGGKSFGLTIAALGFLSASIGGVIHLNILQKKGVIRIASEDESALLSEQIQSDNEIPMQGGMDKMTVQFALIAVTYFLSYLLMMALGNLIPGLKSVIYGFNFLLGVLCATLVSFVIRQLTKIGWIKKQYANNFLLTRCSNFFFDIMVVAGIAAIRLSILEKYWGVILILGVAGLVFTYAYNLLVAKKLFPNYPQEQFLMMYGMLTGTASTGVILLREADPTFSTPAADNMVYQNFPAIVLGFPMMLLATLAPKKPVLTLIILVCFFVALNIALFRSCIFKKKTAKKS